METKKSTKTVGYSYDEIILTEQGTEDNFYDALLFLDTIPSLNISYSGGSFGMGILGYKKMSISLEFKSKENLTQNGQRAIELIRKYLNLPEKPAMTVEKFTQMVMQLHKDLGEDDTALSLF